MSESARESDLSAATVYEAAGRRFELDRSIRPLAPGMRLCGRAYTVVCRAGDNLALHRALARASARAILVVGTSGGTDRTYFGGIMAAAARARGIGGIVLDGFVRDSDELATTVPIFCRGSALGSSEKDQPGELEIETMCAGRIIAPGDLIVGDGDGVVCVPASEASRVLELAAQRQVREDLILAGIREGKSTVALLGLHDPK